MTLAKSQKSIDFDQRLYAVLLKGAQEEVRIEFDDRPNAAGVIRSGSTRAAAFLLRIRKFRLALKRENDIRYQAVAAVKTNREGNIFVARPADSEFFPDLEKAGFNLDSKPTPIALPPNIEEVEDDEWED